MPAKVKKPNPLPPKPQKVTKPAKPAKPPAKPAKPPPLKTITIKINHEKGTIKTDYKGVVDIEYVDCKPRPPMTVFVGTFGSSSYVLTARNVGEARAFLTNVRGGDCDKFKFRSIDQTKKQVWGLFPIVDVIIDKDGRVNVKQMPSFHGGEN